MTREELYTILKKEWEKTDQNDLESIKAYNRYARELRKQIQGDEE